MRHPSSSDGLDPFTTQTLDRMVRDHPWAGDWQRVRERAQRSRRAGRRMPLLISAVAGTLLIVLVMVLSIRTDTRTAAVDSWSDPINGISIDVEEPFRRATLPLAPASHEILSLSTGPLLIGSPTDRLPTQAVQAIGDRGMLITIFELERPEDLSPAEYATPAIGYQQRPASFDLSRRSEANPTSFPLYAALGSGSPGTRRWVIPFTDHDRRLTAVVVAGTAVTDQQLEQTRRILDSLQVVERPTGDPTTAALHRTIGSGRVRYAGTTDGRRAYVAVAQDGKVCTLLDGIGLSCTARAAFQEAGGAMSLDRSDSGDWFGVIVPPGVGTVTANGAPIGEGPQPILMSGIKSDSLVIRQGDVTLFSIS